MIGMPCSLPYEPMRLKWSHRCSCAFCCVSAWRLVVGAASIGWSSISPPERAEVVMSLISCRSCPGVALGGCSSRPPSVGLFDETQVDEGLGLAHAFDGPYRLVEEGQEVLVVL